MSKDLLACCLAAILFLLSSRPNADVLTSLTAGAAIGASSGWDIFGVKEASRNARGAVESALRAIPLLEALIAKGDRAAESRLHQLRKMLEDVANLSADRVLEIERQTYKDAIDLIYRVQCGTENVLQDALPRAYTKLIEQTNTLESKLFNFIPLITFSSSPSAPDHLREYFKLSDAAKKALEERLEKDEKTPAREILATYAAIRRAAFFTQCLYLHDPETVVRLSRDIQEMQRLQTPWVSILHPL